MKKSLLAFGCSAALLGSIVAIQDKASAHGYVSNPPSRAYQGNMDKGIIGWNTAFQTYGSAIDNPQSLEGKKGFPIAGPEDGKIASVNEVLGDDKLDTQDSNQWKKQNLKTGINTFTWTYTASHPTSKWHYYMTKTGWDQNKPLNRDELELIGTVDYDGSTASTNPSHQVTIPSDRSGYHVILAVWDVSDTANAFYNVIDANIEGGETPQEKPKTPSGLSASRITSKTASLAWSAQIDATSFNIYRDGVKIGETSSASFTDEKLAPNTNYTYQVQAKNDQGESSKSEKLEVQTKTEQEIEKPTAPSGLHTMAITENSVNLMFSKAEHSSGIKEYQFFRDGVKVGTTTSTSYTDKDLKSNTEYSYQVKALSNSDEISDSSKTLKVKTEDGGSNYRQFKLGSIAAPEFYQVGEIIQYNGTLYNVLNAHNNYGDSSWAPDTALSLFKKV